MADTSTLTHFKDALVFLGTAAVVVPLFRRLRVSPVIGFIGAGILLGPFCLGRLAEQYPALKPFTFGAAEEMHLFAELGVVFLLFMIGLELSFERLSRMRKLVFGLGAAQVASCSIAIGLAAWLMGESAASASVIGAALALSSKAIVIPVLLERKRMRAAAGRASFSVLLFQDLMVAPFLFMIAMLGAREFAGVSASLLYTLLPAILGMVAIVGLGRLILRPLFRQVAYARSPEFFMAACLLVVIGTSVIAAASGLPMTLGAFMAGLLLAETEYRRQIEVTIEPFKGLLLGLFFVSIGVGLDIGRILSDPVHLFALALGIVVLKALLIYGVARLFGVAGHVAREVSLLLGPGGEFGFVMLGAAMATGIITRESGGALMIAVTLTMLAIPMLGALAAKIAPPNPEADTHGLRDLAPPPDSGEAPVLIAGFGRVGKLVSELLSAHDIPFVAVDGDARLVTAERRTGAMIYWGNASDPELLRRLGISRARGLVVTMDNPQAVERVVAAARSQRDDLVIVARARDALHAKHLYELGASDAIPETIEASLQLSESLLVDIGVPMGLVIASIHEKRDEFRHILQAGQADHKPRRAIRTSKRADIGSDGGTP
jgi:CPA2 family monovalent cation:H+ antiporter-2